MKTTLLAPLFIALFACGSSQSASPEPGPATDPPTTEPVASTPDLPIAADFTLKDLDGADVSLASFRGKTVVLEWFNPGCPFVKYAHGEGPLKDMAATQTAAGVVWLAINSSAPGKEGHGNPVNRNAQMSWKMTHPILLDETGDVGHLYGATSTPAMFVINPEGALIYKGALDNAPLGKAEGEPQNYVELAIEASAKGTVPATRETQSYGCSVKYAQN